MSEQGKPSFLEELISEFKVACKMILAAWKERAKPERKPVPELSPLVQYWIAFIFIMVELGSIILLVLLGRGLYELFKLFNG